MKREIQIALLGLITLALAIWGFQFISGKNMLSGDKTFYTVVNDAKDINTATAVLINGYQVGTVISINPKPEDVKQIVVGFQVKKEIKLPNTTLVEMRPKGAMGGKEFELVFDKYCDGNCAQNGAMLQSKTIGLLGALITPEEINPHIESITASIDKTIGKLGKGETDAPLDQTIKDLSITMENLATTTSRFSNLMAKSSKDMEVTLANMAIITDGLVNSNAKISGILNDVSTLTKDLSKVSLSTTVEKTNGTIDQAQISLKSMEATLAETTAVMKDLNSMVDKMNSSDGSLGLLMSDKTLYDNLKSSSKNMDLLLQDVRLNPRRYLKVFGKKVPDYEVPEEDPADN